MPDAEHPYALLHDPHGVLWYDGTTIWYVGDGSYRWQDYLDWLALGNTPLPAIF